MCCETEPHYRALCGAAETKCAVYHAREHWIAEEIAPPGIRSRIAQEVGDSRIWTVAGLVSLPILDL